MVRPRLLVAAVLVVLAAAGCAPEERQRGAAINDPGTQPSTIPSAAPSGPPAPLLGSTSTEQLAQRRALAVPVQVRPGSTAPAGLDAADLVFLEYAESGSYRFTAVYQSKDSAKIGPVAEIRPTDIRSVSVLNPFVGFNGGGTGFLQQLENSGLPSVSRTARGDLFPSGYTSTGGLFKAAPAGGNPPPAVFSYAAPGEQLADTGTRAAAKVAVTAPGHAATTWAYDETKRVWVTTVNGVVLATTTLILLDMPYRTLEVRNPSPRTLPSAEVFGEGKAHVLSGPSSVDGSWNKSGLKTVCNVTLTDGSLPRIQPGVTWLVYVPAGSTVTVS